MNPSEKSNTILVALDASDFSRSAFNMALELLKPGDSLALIHVIELVETSLLDPLHEPLDRLYNLEQRSKAKIVREFYEHLCRDNEVANWMFFAVESLDARSAICDEVEKLQPKMLIVGSRGMGVLKRLVLGSVSTYCSQNANCPVLIVKSPAEGTPKFVGAETARKSETVKLQ